MKFYIRFVVIVLTVSIQGCGESYIADDSLFRDNESLSEEKIVFQGLPENNQLNLLAGSQALIVFTVATSRIIDSYYWQKFDHITNAYHSVSNSNSNTLRIENASAQDDQGQYRACAKVWNSSQTVLRNHCSQSLFILVTDLVVIPSPTGAPVVTVTPSPTITPTPSSAPSPTPSSAPSSTPSPSPTRAPTATPTPTVMNSNCTHYLENGTYSQNTASTYPSGSVVCARNDGMVTFTGGNWSPQSGTTFVGVRIVGNSEKTLRDNTHYRRVSFVGGPCNANVVNTEAGSNVTIKDSAFYGQGGRYLFLTWHVANVHLENIIFRVDGGCSGFNGEPNATMNFYDSDNVSCVGCVDIDHNQTASGENLGGLGTNCHQTHADMLFENVISKNSRPPYADGQGTCNNVTFKNAYIHSTQDSYSYTRNVKGTTNLVNFSGDARCAAWKGSVIATNSKLASNEGCSGTLNGTGTNVDQIFNMKPDFKTFLNDARWRSELCNGVTRGWCGTNLQLSDYLK